ncbi:MAG: alpha/beta hydrolase fold domain-containing protein, partial [Rhizobiales bacterium]|nr:alpha/beta hydrolase fold domain-containing protein [Hyphomicrobiales bacterium]
LSLPVDVWRERVERLSAAARAPYSENLDVETRIIDGTRPVRVRIYRPRASQPLPVLVYMHGGGWVIGSIDSHDSITAAIAADTPCVVISVDYARAPEHPFPAPMEDCRAVVAWTSANAAAIGVDPAAIFVGGDSAGGNLATAMTIAFRDGSVRASMSISSARPISARHRRLTSKRRRWSGSGTNIAPTRSSAKIRWPFRCAARICRTCRLPSSWWPSMTRCVTMATPMRSD